MGFNSRWGSIVSIFIFDWGSINIFMGWGCNQEWGSNGADTVFHKNPILKIINFPLDSMMLNTVQCVIGPEF